VACSHTNKADRRCDTYGLLELCRNDAAVEYWTIDAYYANVPNDWQFIQSLYNSRSEYTYCASINCRPIQWSADIAFC